MIEKEWWENKELISFLEDLTPMGFKLVTLHDGTVRFDKVETNRIVSIGLGIVMKKILHPDYIQSYISFFDIDGLIEPKLLKSLNIFDSYTLRSRNHGLIFNLEEGKGINEILPIELVNEEAFIQAKQLIQTYINTYPKPFFDYWTDIRCFLPFIETADGRKLNDYFTGYPTERKMIIWHLCNHPKSKEFTNETLKSWEEYSEANPNDAIFKRWTKNMQRIVKVLSKTPPLYEWDDSYLIAKKLIM